MARCAQKTSSCCPMVSLLISMFRCCCFACDGAERGGTGYLQMVPEPTNFASPPAVTSSNY